MAAPTYARDVQEWHAVEVPAALQPHVARLSGYRLSGFAPGVHVGMPSPTLTLVVALGEPLLISRPGHDAQPYTALVGGLHEAPVGIHHDGNQFGLQLDLTPAGSRALLGCPAGALTHELVDLSDLLAAPDRHVAEQAEAAPDWSSRVELLLAALTRRLDGAHDARPEVSHAWDEIRRTCGTVPVWAVASSVGWSTRHLGEQFRAEYGLSVKTAARIARFDRSRALIQSRRLPLAEVAAECGFADQAHLNRDWRQFAGTSPGHWADIDELAFVQDPAE